MRWTGYDTAICAVATLTGAFGFCLAVALMEPAPAPAVQGIAPPPPATDATKYSMLPPYGFQGDTAARVSFVSEHSTRAALCDSDINPQKRTSSVWACYNEGQDLLIVENPCALAEAEPASDAEHFVATLCHEMGHRNGWRHEQ